MTGDTDSLFWSIATCLVAVGLIFVAWTQQAGQLTARAVTAATARQDSAHAVQLAYVLAALDTSSCVAWHRPDEDPVTWFERARVVAPKGGHLP